MSGLPLNADDPFLPYLREVVDRNFPISELQLYSSDCPIAHPITFHDRHLDSALTLKHVKIVPKLAESLAEYCTAILDEFVHNGYNFNLTEYSPVSRLEPRDPMREAFSVGMGFSELSGKASIQLATKILLTPDVAEWTRLIFFSPGDLTIPPGREFFADGRLFVSKVKPVPINRDAQDLDRVYDSLASWSFYSLTRQARKAISKMSSMSQFHWESAHTIGPPSPSHLPVPPDAPEGFANEKIAEYLSGRRKGAETTESSQPWSKKQTIKVPRLRKSQLHSPAVKHYIQKGWSTAVREDATFLIFNCGSHERIGIRHRESQTLCLSGLIDTAHTTPTYGMIQLGLHLAIIRDSLSRIGVRTKFNEEHKLSLKRPLDGGLDIDENMPVAKRPKTDTESPEMTLANSSNSISDTDKEMSKRTALLVNLMYGNYCSPSPSCFARLGTSCVEGLFVDKYEPPTRRITYDSSQYMTATLRTPIGKGAIGTAHRGTVELSTPSGKKLSQPCLVKFAFDQEAQTALKHEFDMYQHLARKDVFTGILQVHGLFQDIQTDTMALLMDYGGYSLRRREYELYKKFDQNFVMVEENERAIIFKALEQIHNAGLCHNDVRVDNIVVNEDNKVAFIDFDRAAVPKRPVAFETELDELRSTIWVSCSDDSASDVPDDNEWVQKT